MLAKVTSKVSVLEKFQDLFGCVTGLEKFEQLIFIAA
jgi:hypothetical protein